MSYFFHLLQEDRTSSLRRAGEAGPPSDVPSEGLWLSLAGSYWRLTGSCLWKYRLCSCGRMAERPIAVVLKTIEVNASGGSNPSPSATKHFMAVPFRRQRPRGLLFYSLADLSSRARSAGLDKAEGSPQGEKSVHLCLGKLRMRRIVSAMHAHRRPFGCFGHIPSVFSSHSHRKSSCRRKSAVLMSRKE